MFSVVCILWSFCHPHLNQPICPGRFALVQVPPMVEVIPPALPVDLLEVIDISAIVTSFPIKFCLGVE